MTGSRLTLLLAGALLLGGCNGEEGRFLPGCLAYAGSEITLAGDRFTWDRFTDQIEIDADGNRIDPYPGYPVSGDFAMDGNRVVMIGDDGTAMDAMYLHRIGDDVRLLTETQNAEFEGGGEIDDCSLLRQAADSQ